MIKDKGLVTRLGDFYEHRQIRLVYNGEAFDNSFEQLGMQYVPEVYDFQRRELITTDRKKIAALYARVRWIKVWAVWYLDSLSDYEIALNQLAEDVEGYLLAN